MAVSNVNYVTSEGSLSSFYSDIKLGLKTGYKHNTISFITSFSLFPLRGNVSYYGSPNIIVKLKTTYALSFAYDYVF